MIEVRMGPSVVCGRKFCTICTRWRHVSDFRAMTVKNKTGRQYCVLRAYCNVCAARKKAENRRDPVIGGRIRRLQRARKRQLSGRPALKQGRQSGRSIITLAQAKPGSVRREPFARWLYTKRAAIGMTMLVKRTGMAERHVLGLINGYDMGGSPRRAGGKRRTRLRPIDWVSLETVDRALTNYGEHWRLNEMYPLSEEELVA